MASKIYLKGLEQAFLGNLDIANDTIQALLVTDGYTFAQTHNFVSAVVAHEAAGTSRQTLGSKTVTIDTANGRIEIDAENPTFPTVSGSQNISGIVIFKQVTNDADSFLIAFGDATDLAGNGSGITVPFDADGFVQVSN